MSTMTKLEARAANLKFYEGKRCNTCGGTQRRASNGICIYCEKANRAAQKYRPAKRRNVKLYNTIGHTDRRTGRVCIALADVDWSRKVYLCYPWDNRDMWREVSHATDERITFANEQFRQWIGKERKVLYQ